MFYNLHVKAESCPPSIVQTKISSCLKGFNFPPIQRGQEEVRGMNFKKSPPPLTAAAPEGD